MSRVIIFAPETFDRFYRGKKHLKMYPYGMRLQDAAIRAPDRHLFRTGRARAFAGFDILPCWLEKY